MSRNAIVTVWFGSTVFRVARHVTLAVLAVGFATARLDAEVVFQDDFEGRAVGSALPDAPPQVGSHYANGGTAVDITTNPPGSVPAGGSIFAQGPMNTDDHRWFITPASQTSLTGKVVNFNFDMYIVSNPAVVQLVDINTFTDAGFSGRGISFQLKTDGSARYYDGSFHDVVGSFTTDQWINVDITADFGANTFQVTAGTLNFSGAMNGATNFQSVLFYTQLAAPGPATYFYDNVLVNVVPEPASLASLAAGVLGLIGFGRLRLS